MSDLVARVDGAIGRAVEGTTTRHHRRRLSRVGWAGAYDPAGAGILAGGDPPMRAGNAVDILVDGVEAFGSMLEAIGSARSSINITGWHANPSFALDAADPPSRLREVLSRCRPACRGPRPPLGRRASPDLSTVARRHEEGA